MVLPKLIHPIPVVLELLNTSVLKFDPDTKEVIPGGMGRTTVALKAQVQWTEEDRLRTGDAVPRDQSKGYLLFRQRDLDNKGISISRSDKIVRIGKLTDLELYVISTKPRGHYPDQGGHTLLQADFSDREPVQ